MREKHLKRSASEGTDITTTAVNSVASDAKVDKNPVERRSASGIADQQSSTASVVKPSKRKFTPITFELDSKENKSSVVKIETVGHDKVSRTVDNKISSTDAIASGTTAPTSQSSKLSAADDLPIVGSVDSTDNHASTETAETIEQPPTNQAASDSSEKPSPIGEARRKSQVTLKRQRSGGQQVSDHLAAKRASLATGER
jgi:hypothetical protein